jgi:hypothetical protein
MKKFYEILMVFIICVCIIFPFLMAGWYGIYWYWISLICMIAGTLPNFMTCYFLCKLENRK